MILKRTNVFDRWLGNLRDQKAKDKILDRMLYTMEGNLGDHHSVGGGVSEMRIQYGPGYRLYYTERGEEIILLLCGGNKNSQQRDIAKAKAMVKEIKEQE
jgi:putative addiction module killer protein